MSTTEQMLDAHPADLGGIDQNRLAGCIDACLDCAQACTATLLAGTATWDLRSGGSGRSAGARPASPD